MKQGLPMKLQSRGKRWGPEKKRLRGLKTLPNWPAPSVLYSVGAFLS